MWRHPGEVLSSLSCRDAMKMSLANMNMYDVVEKNHAIGITRQDLYEYLVNVSLISHTYICVSIHQHAILHANLSLKH